MNTRAEARRVMGGMFQSRTGGSIPTSAHSLFFHCIDLRHAKQLNALWHSRFPDVGGGGSRVNYAAEFDDICYAVAIWTNPSAAKLPQQTWLMLKRYAIANDAPKNTASRMMGWMIRDIKKRFPEVVMLVSYSDPNTHEGTIYRATGWKEGKTTKRTIGSKQWHNRERWKRSKNEACELVTRWTYDLRPESN